MTANISKRHTILIVDDVMVNRKLLNKIFREDYNIVEATNGIEALSELSRYRDRISVVILDLLMPKLDGFGVLERMRAEKLLPLIPVVVVTANGDEENQVKVLDLGAEDIISKPFSPKIVLHRVNNIIARRENEKAQERNRLYEQRLAQQEEFIRISERDDITGLYNKGAFCRHTEQLLSENSEKNYVLVRWDIDRFKVFNDIYGARAGDAFLRACGALLQQFDSETVVMGHWDADHFLICCETTVFEDEKFSRWLEARIRENSPEFEFVPRVGIYIISEPARDITVMCDRAFLALRSIKGKYTERFAYYDESMRAALLEEQEIIGEVNQALQTEQFVIYLQPQYNHADGKMVGAEVLVRWQHPEKGLIPPGKFIAILEDNGLITRLDEYVWECACKLLRKWLDQGEEPVPLSVNISRIDVYRPQLCEFIISLVEKYQLSPQLLRLEITESAYMNNPSQLIGVVNKLRAYGFVIEMDDFGSGYSSLNTLKDVPVDVLKLDMKFLSEGGESTRGGNILSSIVRMAHWLKLPVIAEGVETIQQADYLKSIGCLCMQGYLFARPMPVCEFEERRKKEVCGVLIDRYQKTDIAGAADFWDATAQATLLFNSFVGGAAIVEYTGTNVEILRVNDRFIEELGTTRERYIAEQTSILPRFYEESREAFLTMLRTAIETGKETACEVCSKPLEEGSPDIWTSIRARFLAQNIDSYIFYLSVENITHRRNLILENHALNEQLKAMAECK